MEEKYSKARELAESETSEPSCCPADSYNIGYYSFIIFGIGSLLPWNSVLTAIDFFDHQLPSHKPSFVFALVLNTPSFLFAFVNIFLSKMIPLGGRIVASFAVILVITILMPLVTEFVPEAHAWTILVILIALLGVGNAFSQGAVFGLATVFPTRYIAITMFAQGLSGLSLNLIRILMLVIFPPTDSDVGNNDFKGSIIYFSLAALVILLGIILYFVLMKSRYAQFFISRADENIHQDFFNLSSANLVTVDEQNGNNTRQDYYAPLLLRDEVEERRYSDYYPIVDQYHHIKGSSYLEIYSKVWHITVQITIGFTITFTVFPGTSLSTNFSTFGKSKSDMAWFSIIIITIFNFGDTSGRLIAGKIKKVSLKTATLLTILRLVFIPSFIMIQLKSSPVSITDSDWFKIVNMALFAFTNGVNSTVMFMLAPKQVNAQDKEKVGLISSFHLLGGIFLGSLIASTVMHAI